MANFEKPLFARAVTSVAAKFLNDSICTDRIIIQASVAGFWSQNYYYRLLTTSEATRTQNLSSDFSGLFLSAWLLAKVGEETVQFEFRYEKNQT